MHDFQGYFSRTFQDLKLQFPGLSRTKVIFQDFPGPGIFKKKIQDFPGGVGTLILLLITSKSKVNRLSVKLLLTEDDVLLQDGDQLASGLQLIFHDFSFVAAHT